MPVKSQRVSISVTAITLEEAIAQLAHTFLRFNKSGIRAVSQPTDYPVLHFCARLVADWQSGKVPYEPGEVTLSFSAEPEGEADLLVYKPQTDADSEGACERLLYSRRTAPLPKPAARTRTSGDTVPPPLEAEAMQPVLRQLHVLHEVLEQLTEAQRALEVRLRAAAAAEQSGREALDARAEVSESEWAEAVSQMREAIAAHSADLVQQFASQLTAATLHLHERLNQMQGQIDQLVAQLEGSEDSPPQTEAEWRSRIQQTWGTVGDYEQYSTSHREVNAETPLFHTPDWVALCELEWARKLCPPLAVLHQLIHEENGIGDIGADILQQFGQHLDPRTGDRYYIYQLGGYSASEALWRTVQPPQQSWLPELRRLSQRLARHPEIFEMFGWQSEAIAALDQVVQQATYQQRANDSYQRQSVHPHQRAGNTLSDYLAILNLGPFTPLTLETIKQAYKQTMKVAHPDTGGSKEQAQRVNEAYEAILRHYFPNAI